MDKIKRGWNSTPKKLRQTLVGIIGVLVIIAGCFLLVLPGPGWATIFLGLAILASEFERAEKLKAMVVARFKSAIARARTKNKR